MIIVLIVWFIEAYILNTETQRNTERDNLKYTYLYFPDIDVFFAFFVQICDYKRLPSKVLRLFSELVIISSTFHSSKAYCEPCQVLPRTETGKKRLTNNHRFTADRKLFVFDILSSCKNRKTKAKHHP